MRRAIASLLALTAAACVPLPDFDDESLIDRPRVLAIVAEPPEVTKGASTELSLLLALPDQTAHDAGADALAARATWNVCGAFFTTFRGSQYGDQPDDQGCRGGFSVPLEALDAHGMRAVLPGALTGALFESLELAAASFGAVLPEATVEVIRERVGLALVVEATVVVGGRELRAIKRVLVSESTMPHGNPDPAHFDLLDGDASLAEIVTDPVQPMRCAAVTGEVPVIEAGQEVELAPRVPEVADADAGADGGEPWLEDYQVLNARGELEPRRERAFYSWFSTAGRFSDAVTRSPLRNTLWRAPRTPGPYPIWLVIRDGHGGTRACRLDVEVR
jgi:hypothetical protein